MLKNDPTRKAFGIRVSDVEAASSLIAQARGFTSPLQSLPTAASVGEFSEVQDIFGSNRNDKGRFQNRSDDPWSESMEEFNLLEGGYDFTNLAEETGGEVRHKTSSPAPLSVVPTSTINPDRPRTVAAGYDKAEQKLTVVFRDGTFYNYYEVTAGEWGLFKQNKSKGRYIKAFLDSKPRGAADVDGTDSAIARMLVYRVARTSQTVARTNGERARQINYGSRNENRRRF